MKKTASSIIIVLLCISMFSIFAPKVKAEETVIFQDDFESYAVGSFPSSGGWEIVWIGAGNHYQVITDSYYASPTKSLQLIAINEWNMVEFAGVKRDFSSSSEIIGFEVSVLLTEDSLGYVGFSNMQMGSWGRFYATIGLGNHSIFACEQDNYYAYELQELIPNTWYKLRIVLDRSTRRYSVWINDVLRGQDIAVYYDPWDILSLQLFVAADKNYFDDVKIFEIGEAPPPQGDLVGYWSFNEGSGAIVRDGSGNSNHGVLNNGPVWVDGRFGKALSFDGVDDYVRIEPSSSLDVTSQITVEAWVYPRAYVDSNGDNSHIISRCAFNGGAIYVLQTYSPTSTKAGYAVNQIPWHHASSADLPLNTWTHLAMTYDGTTVKLYINGEFDSSYAQSGPIEVTSNWLAFGCKPTGPWGGAGTYAYFNGIIDEVRIYNRALSQQEIQTDMGGPAPPLEKHDIAVKSAVLLGTSWWRDEGNNIAEIKLGQIVPIKAVVENQGDFDENFEVQLYISGPTGQYVESISLFLASGDSTDVYLSWDTNKDKPLVDRIYGMYVKASLDEDTDPTDNIANIPYNMRVLQVFSKNWQVKPHEDSMATIKWEFPDNFWNDGSTAHNHRRNKPFYAMAVWDNNNLTLDQYFDGTTYHIIWGNWEDSGFDEKTAPWYFYYAHGFISYNSPLKYYFESSFPENARIDVRNALNAWSNIRDTSRDDIFTGIFFKEVTSVSDIRYPGKDADIIFYWRHTNFLGQKVYLGGTIPQPREIDGKSGFYMQVFFSNRTWWHYGNPQETPFYEYSFYSVALHEIGHALGLAHTTNINEVMYPEIPLGVAPSIISGESKERALDLYSIPVNQYLKVAVHSPAHILIIDPLGRKVGYDSTTATFLHDIPYAKVNLLDTEPESVVIPWPLNGTYVIQLIGIADGSYTLNLTLSTDSSTFMTQTFSGTITNGSIQTFTADIATLNFKLYSWDYVFKDAKRDTILRINTRDKYFQFIAPNKDFGVKYDFRMIVLKHVIICFEDEEMRLIATAVDDKIDFCSAIAFDKQTRKTYILIDKPNH
ncbi:MAG: LamG-like jellyroll fold domain-containing protein [Candidatus Bathyarchaeia archaeon]